MELININQSISLSPPSLSPFSPSVSYLFSFPFSPFLSPPFSFLLLSPLILPFPLSSLSASFLYLSVYLSMDLSHMLHRTSSNHDHEFREHSVNSARRSIRPSCNYFILSTQLLDLCLLNIVKL